MVYLERWRAASRDRGLHGGAPEVIQDSVSGYLVPHGIRSSWRLRSSAAGRPRPCEGDGARGKQRAEHEFRFNVFAKSLKKILPPMRILNVTETTLPFSNSAAPGEGARAFRRPGRRGHQVTVVTADWAWKSACKRQEEKHAERSPFGWRREEMACNPFIYLHGYDTVELAGIRRSSVTAGRLQNFDIVHISDFTTLLGSSSGCGQPQAGLPYVLEPIGCSCQLCEIFAETLYHASGKAVTTRASAVIATSNQEAEELVAVVFLARAWCCGETAWKCLHLAGTRHVPEAQGISKHVKLVLFLGRLSVKEESSSSIAGIRGTF